MLVCTSKFSLGHFWTEPEHLLLKQPEHGSTEKVTLFMLWFYGIHFIPVLYFEFRLNTKWMELLSCVLSHLRSGYKVDMSHSFPGRCHIMLRHTCNASVYCVQSIFLDASSSDVGHYVIIIRLLDSVFHTRWDPQSPYRRRLWAQYFSPVRMPTQGTT